MLFYPSGMRQSRVWVCCSNAGDWGSCPWSGWSLSEDLSGHSAFLKGIWSAGWKKATGKAKANQHELFEFDWTLTACLFFNCVYFFLRTFWAVTSTLYILVWIHKVCKRQSLVYHHTSSKESVDADLSVHVPMFVLDLSKILSLRSTASEPDVMWALWALWALWGYCKCGWVSGYIRLAINCAKCISLSHICIYI